MTETPLKHQQSDLAIARHSLELYRQTLQETVYLTDVGTVALGAEIAQARFQYQEKSAPLHQQLTEYAQEFKDSVFNIRGKRTKVSNELLNLQYAINFNIDHRSNDWYRVWPRIHFADLDFGFCLPDVLALLNHTVSKDIYPQMFLRNCEATREALTPIWPTGRNSKDTSIFSDRDKERFPIAQVLDAEYQPAMDILSSAFISGDGLTGIEKSKSHFSKSLEILSRFKDRRSPRVVIDALKAFYEFMSTDQAMIFQGPTLQKYNYEQSMYQDDSDNQKRQVAKDALDLWIDEGKYSASAQRLLKAVYIPFKTTSVIDYSLPTIRWHHQDPWGYGEKGVWQCAYALSPQATELYSSQQDEDRKNGLIDE